MLGSWRPDPESATDSGSWQSFVGLLRRWTPERSLTRVSLPKMRQPRVTQNEDSGRGGGGREGGSDKPAEPMPATGCPGSRPPFPGRSPALFWAGDPGHTWLGRLLPPAVPMGAEAQAPQLCTCYGLSALCQRGGLGYCPDQPPCCTVFTPTPAHTRSGSEDAEAMSASGRVGRALGPI